MRSEAVNIKQCFEEWLLVEPRLSGQLNVRFTVDTYDGVDGRFSEVSVGDAGVGGLAMEKCLLSTMSHLRFDPPLDGTIRVTFPFSFVSPDSGR